MRTGPRSLGERPRGVLGAGAEPFEEETPLPRVRLPIPFVLELAALCGVAVPALAGLHRGACALRLPLLSLGVLLTLPAAAVLLLRARFGRAWLLARFAAGQYVFVGARHRPLPCAWRPSQWLHWHESEDALADAGARRPARRALHSFGFWTTRPFEETTPQSSAEVTAEQAAAAGASASASRSAARGATAGDDEETSPQSIAEVAAEQAATHAADAGGSAPGSAARVATSGGARPGPTLVVSCRELRLEGARASLQESGHLAGLPWECRFDGSCLLAWPQGASRPPRLLAKVGAWRWDWASKVLISLVALGACAAVPAAVLPPGQDFHCVRRPPLRAFFLLEGPASAGSRGPADWGREKDAAVGIMSAFQSIYSGDSGGGSLHVGAAEVSDPARPVVHMTGDVTRASALVQGMELSGGGAVLSQALRTCQNELSNYTAAGDRTFDLCVVITDGVSMDVRSRANLSTYLESTTELFGIHVGGDPAGMYNLHSISSPGFFLSIPSYRELPSVRSAVAANVARASEDRFGLAEQPLPWWLPLCLLGSVPFLAWWAWLLIPRPRPEEAAGTGARGQRLRRAWLACRVIPRPRPGGPGTEMACVQPADPQRLRRGRPIVEDKWSARDFWFVPAAVFLRLPDNRQMPCHQTLRDSGVLVRRRIAWQDIISGKLAEDTVAVSHRWKEDRHPDPDMSKLRKLKGILGTTPNIKFLWMDWMCAPQKFRDDGSLGGRTSEEGQEFDEILASILPCLYLGARVVILWDRQYNSRFWPNVESWTAMQMPTPRGLVPAPAKRLRALFFGVASADGQDKHVKQLMMAAWHKKTANEAIGVLAADDILVTNAKDKTISLNVVASLDDDVGRASYGQISTGLSQTISKRLRGSLDCG